MSVASGVFLFCAGMAVPVVKRPRAVEIRIEKVKGGYVAFRPHNRRLTGRGRSWTMAINDLAKLTEKPMANKSLNGHPKQVAPRLKRGQRVKVTVPCKAKTKPNTYTAVVVHPVPAGARAGAARVDVRVEGSDGRRMRPFASQCTLL